MSDGISKEIVLHCLKFASDFHDEICEECPMYSKCDHTWKSKVYERALEPVSYTHLDVYKRQRRQSAMTAVICLLASKRAEKRLTKSVLKANSQPS